MRIDIKASGFRATAPLLDHTERRLRFALARSSDRIKRVVVRFGDSNGPRGGEDKFCRVQVHFEHAPPVLIEDAGADLYAVIDRAAERAGRNAVKHAARLQENLRLAGRRPLRALPDAAVDMSNN